MCAHKANMCSCPEKLDGEMLPSCSGILAKTVSIASYSLQQDNLLLLPRFCNAAFAPIEIPYSTVINRQLKHEYV